MNLFRKKKKLTKRELMIMEINKNLQNKREKDLMEHISKNIAKIVDYTFNDGTKSKFRNTLPYTSAIVDSLEKDIVEFEIEPIENK